MDLSLDDIIARNKASKRGGGGGKARNGGATKFTPRNGSSGRAHAAAAPAASHRSGLAAEINAHKRVRINIAHLAPSVRTGDLEELFSAYGVESASVNYGEGGHHLGTGDLILSKRDAHRVLNDFAGVTVDGQRLTMILVEDDGAGSASIFNRIKLAGGGGGVQKRPQQQQQRRGGSGPAARGGARGGAAGGGRGGKAAKKQPRTEADLDAELDAYMSSKKIMAD